MPEYANHFVLPPGKLPNDLLNSVLDAEIVRDPSLLTPPGVGEDTAAVASDEEVMLLKSDPITFATEHAAFYAVRVNANDIHVSGGVPRWFLTTLLLPTGITAGEVRELIGGLSAACREEGILLAGGHTEITDAVNRVVISGMMVGTVSRSGLVDKRNMRPGDQVFFSKALAMEGTSLLAREFASPLRRAGVSDKLIADAAAFLEQLSVGPEARLALAVGGVSAMHDVTEGGFATAVRELGRAGGHPFRIDLERLPLSPVTAALCEAIGCDPLGLIGSGSLILTLRPDRADELRRRCAEQGIALHHIGEVLPPEADWAFYRGEKTDELPEFERDEIARLFEEQA